MICNIQGPAKISVRNITISFGMNDSVASLIEVAAWKMLTKRPVTSAASSIGAETSSSTKIACLPTSITYSGVMVASGVASARKTCNQRADDQLPAIDQHEQHQLERQRHH